MKNIRTLDEALGRSGTFAGRASKSPPHVPLKSSSTSSEVDEEEKKKVRLKPLGLVAFSCVITYVYMYRLGGCMYVAKKYIVVRMKKPIKCVDWVVACM